MRLTQDFNDKVVHSGNKCVEMNRFYMVTRADRNAGGLLKSHTGVDEGQSAHQLEGRRAVADDGVAKKATMARDAAVPAAHCGRKLARHGGSDASDASAATTST